MGNHRDYRCSVQVKESQDWVLILKGVHVHLLGDVIPGLSLIRPTGLQGAPVE